MSPRGCQRRHGNAADERNIVGILCALDERLRQDFDLGNHRCGERHVRDDHRNPSATRLRQEVGMLARKLRIVRASAAPSMT